MQVIFRSKSKSQSIELNNKLNKWKRTIQSNKERERGYKYNNMYNNEESS